MVSYIGITGFASQTEVQRFDAAIRCERSTGGTLYNEITALGKQIMVGVLMSYKTLYNILPDNPKRYPKVEDIKKIFIEDPIYLNTIHYNTHSGIAESLSEQLDRIVLLIPNLNAIQLNIAWPEYSEVERFSQQHPNIRIILQVGRTARVRVGNSVDSLVLNVKKYQSVVNTILLDMSGGEAVLLDPQFIAEAVFSLSNYLNPAEIAIAGGLNSRNVAKTLNRIQNFLPTIPFSEISIDAEGGLRTEDDRLDIKETIKYLEAVNNYYRQ